MTDPPPRLAIGYGVRPAQDLLRDVAAEFHQVPASHVVLTHECPGCGSSEHGCPRLLATAAVRRPAYVSLARSGDLSVVAVTDAGPVGIDVEVAGAADFLGFADVALHPDERSDAAVDPTLVWVRKEALLKACGLGLAVDPSRVRVDEAGIRAWDSPAPQPLRVWLRDLEVTGHAASVVVLPTAAPDADLAVTVASVAT